MSDTRDEDARRYIAERDAREAAERERCTGPDGRYVSLPPTEEALRDLVERAARVEHGAWMRPSPSGYWLDLVAMGRELLAAREALRAADALADALDDFVECPDHAQGAR